MLCVVETPVALISGQATDLFDLGESILYLALTLNFGTLNTLMSGVLGFPVSMDLYNSFDTLLISFHGLLSIIQKCQ